MLARALESFPLVGERQITPGRRRLGLMAFESKWMRMSDPMKKKKKPSKVSPSTTESKKVIKDTWFELFSHTSYDSLKCVVLIQSLFLCPSLLSSLRYVLFAESGLCPLVSISWGWMRHSFTILMLESVCVFVCGEWRSVCWHLCNTAECEKKMGDGEKTIKNSRKSCHRQQRPHGMGWLAFPFTHTHTKIVVKKDTFSLNIFFYRCWAATPHAVRFFFENNERHHSEEIKGIPKENRVKCDDEAKSKH